MDISEQNRTGSGICVSQVTWCEFLILLWVELAPGFPPVLIIIALGQAMNAPGSTSPRKLLRRAPPLPFYKFPSWSATLKHNPKGLRGMSDNPSA